MIAKLVRESIPKRFGMNPMEEIQILTPMQKGALGARNLNATMQRALNPTGDQVERFGTIFRCGDRVMQTENDYNKEIYNGDLGYIEMIDLEASEISIRFDERSIMFDVRELDSLLHAYAITIHKSQGSEYPAVIIPLHTQHYIMLQRTLIYTAITRAKKLAILVGTTKALQLAVSQTLSKSRTTQLATCLQQSS
jgi:exodeoxyribonuclease V alpha subunit